MAQQYRAEFDAVVTFSGGGDLQTRGFRIDVPRLDPTEAELIALFLGVLGRPAVDRVELTGIRVFAEPSLDLPARSGPRLRHVELSHVIEDGMVTYPGLPAPTLSVHLSFANSRSSYAEGTEFSMDRIDLLGQTGTYLDSPAHRYDGGTDLAGLSLDRLADLPAVVVRTAGSGRRAVEAADIEPLVVAGHAVLLHTGGDLHWRTPEYAVDAPYLTGEAAALLVERGAALVGIDSINMDRMTPRGERPAHTLLLAAGIPVVEHLTGLAELPPTGARFTAAPPRITGFGTFPVRAFATLAWFETH
ncbi:MAG: cyclase family protein, partial [Actinoplanes sp.]